MGRIAPLPPEQWPPAMRDALAPLRAVEQRVRDSGHEARPKGLNVLGVFARHPALARAYNVFNGHLQSTSTLSHRHRELVVLRVAAVRRSAYAWRQHTLLAADAGVRDEEVAAIGADPHGRPWPVPEGAILRAVDELLQDASVSEGTWRELADVLTTDQLMDLVFTVGGYDCLVMAIGALGIEPEPDLVSLTAPPPFAAPH